MFFDSKTGYLIFKNSSLLPGHVEPRPQARFELGSKTQTNWNLLYGKTHNPDGTPLNPYK